MGAGQSRHHILQMYRTVCRNPHSVDKSVDIEDDDDDEEAGEIDRHSSLVKHWPIYFFQLFHFFLF